VPSIQSSIYYPSVSSCPLGHPSITTTIISSIILSIPYPFPYCPVIIHRSYPYGLAILPLSIIYSFVHSRAHRHPSLCPSPILVLMALPSSIVAYASFSLISFSRTFHCPLSICCPSFYPHPYVLAAIHRRLCVILILSSVLTILPLSIGLSIVVLILNSVHAILPLSIPRPIIIL